VAAARGGWSSTTHRHWPTALKTAARTLLLVVNRISRSRAEGLGGASEATWHSPSASCQAALPTDVLLRIIQLAAEPLSYWGFPEVLALAQT
jgi:hypothetical protein